MSQASINIDLDTLSEDIDGNTRIIQSQRLRAITYRVVMPRLLELLDRHAIKATFFVIGRDIAEYEDVLRPIARDGHELANHTMNHPKQLVHLDLPTIEREIEECGAQLEHITGRPTVGFRAPGYTISLRVIDALRRAGYRYDSSLSTSFLHYAVKKAFKAVRLKDKTYLTTQNLQDTIFPAATGRGGRRARRQGPPPGPPPFV